jgi:hypothetical protein
VTASATPRAATVSAKWASGMVSQALRAARPAAQTSRTGRAGVLSVILAPPFVG